VYARCPDCHHRFPVLAGTGAQALDCSACGKRHRVQIPDAAVLTRLEREGTRVATEDTVSVVLGLVTLEDALSHRAPRRPVRPRPPRSAPPVETRRGREVPLAIAALALVAVLAGYRFVERRTRDVPELLTRPALPASAELVHDDRGTLVGIRAADPESVLIAYCAAGPAPCRPRELAYGSRPEAGLRLGVVERAGAALPAAIEIRRRGGVHDWFAGDGTGIALRSVPARKGAAVPVGTRRR
jgi:hypothetical protein